MNKVEFVKTLCKERKIPISKLERDCGFGNGYIGQLKKGTFPDDRLIKVAEYLALPLSYLTTGEMPKSATEHGVKIPVLGHVAAGIPISAIEDILDWEEISQETANTGQYFGLQIKGDSMEPRILDGDVVIVRSQPTAETGDIVIAQVNGDEATCKKLLMQSDGLSLLSFNPKYNPMVFTAAEVESKPVRIIGKVVELRAKF